MFFGYKKYCFVVLVLFLFGYKSLVATVSVEALLPTERAIEKMLGEVEKIDEFFRTNSAESDSVQSYVEEKHIFLSEEKDKYPALHGFLDSLITLIANQIGQIRPEIKIVGGYYARAAAITQLTSKKSQTFIKSIFISTIMLRLFVCSHSSLENRIKAMRAFIFCLCHEFGHFRDQECILRTYASKATGRRLANLMPFFLLMGSQAGFYYSNLLDCCDNRLALILYGTFFWTSREIISFAWFLKKQFLSRKAEYSADAFGIKNMRLLIPDAGPHDAAVFFFVVKGWKDQLESLVQSHEKKQEKSCFIIKSLSSLGKGAYNKISKKLPRWILSTHPTYEQRILKLANVVQSF